MHCNFVYPEYFHNLNPDSPIFLITLLTWKWPLRSIRHKNLSGVWVIVCMVTIFGSRHTHTHHNNLKSNCFIIIVSKINCFQKQWTFKYYKQTGKKFIQSLFLWLYRIRFRIKIIVAFNLFFVCVSSFSFSVWSKIN